MRRAFPPVGVQSTAEQALQSTTVWEWLKTVVLEVEGGVSLGGEEQNKTRGGLTC